MNQAQQRTRMLSITMGLMVVLIVLFTLGWWLGQVWHECRAFGHSWLFCLKVIGP